MWLGILPLGLSRYDFHCPRWSTTAAWAGSSGGNISFSRHHMHITGTALQMTVIDQSGHVRHKVRTDHYDFNYQGTRDEDAANPVTNEPTLRILPGDEVITSCWFDNRLPPLGRKIGDPATHKWGPASNDEMCTAIMSYMPATPGLKSCRNGQNGATLKSVSVIAPWQTEDDFVEREFGRPPVAPDAPPTCVDAAGPGAFTHPTLGGCSAFTAELCELNGRETVGDGGASASTECCVCKAITPSTCSDAYFHVRSTRQSSPGLTTCDALVSGFAAYRLGCDTRLEIMSERTRYFFPDKAHTIAAVCPQTCGLCAGTPLPDMQPAIVTFDATIAGTVSSFDSATQTSFKAGLAASLSAIGVLPSDIHLDIAAASIIVSVTIRTTHGTATRLKTQVEAFTPATLSAALGGLSVEAISEVTTAAGIGGEADDGESGSGIDTTTLVLAIAFSVSALLSVVAGGVVVYMKRKSNAVTTPQELSKTAAL